MLDLSPLLLVLLTAYCVTGHKLANRYTLSSPIVHQILQIVHAIAWCIFLPYLVILIATVAFR